MMSKWKLIPLGILLSLSTLLTGCGAPLLKAENPLIKADTVIPPTDIQPTHPPTETLFATDSIQQPQKLRVQGAKI